MKIKTRLMINTLISLCVVIFILLSLVWSVREIVIAEWKMSMVHDMRKVAFERILLRDEYLLYHEKRAKTQWHAKSGELRDLLARADEVFNREKDKALLHDARKDFEANFSEFSRVIAGHAMRERSTKKRANYSEAESRQISHVFLKAYSLADGINRLNESAEQEAKNARNRGAVIVLLAMLCGISAIMINSSMIRKTLAKRIAILGKGAEIIGAGDLDHRIEAVGNDELAELARASNEMAVKLSRSYTSVENLQKETAERKNAEEAFQSLSLRYEAMLASVPDIIMEVDSNKVYTWVNKAGSTFFGDDVIGREAVYYFEGEQKTYDKVQPLFNGSDDVIYVESWQRRKDGERRLLAWWCRVLKAPDGTVTGALSSAQDITERKRAEEEIRKLNEELEQRVAERTAQLRAANKELEAFSYSVSHDLRAPLRHMAGFVELLMKRSKTLDDKSRHYLDVISHAATQMGRLVDDLLSFSRMGRTEIMRSQFLLRDAVDDAIADLKADLVGRVVSWDIGDLPEITGDPAMLKYAFINLLSNALKFTRLRPQARIEIGRGSATTQDEVVVYVKDNGVGFDMQYVDKLFNLFQRLHRAEEFEGTGLGLANVRRIVTRHGGRTWAEGVIGEGATVYFSLPVIRAS